MIGFRFRDGAKNGILTPLLMILAHATHRELIGQIQYLRTENQVLRSKPPRRMMVTAQERTRNVTFYNECRPHQAKGNAPLGAAPPPEALEAPNAGRSL